MYSIASPPLVYDKVMPATAVSDEQLTELIESELAGLIDIRHDLHAHPQLGYEETYASTKVREHLTRLNIPHEAGMAKTGVVGWLVPDGADTSQGVGLRADMDALPIQEQSDLPWKSQHDGLMHACGHDGHTTILMGAAAVLAKLRHQLPRPVKLVFQPAEEGLAGGQKMVEAGVLDESVGGVKVTSMFGLHGFPLADVGKMLTRPHAILAAADKLDIRVTGKGGHAAAPHLCIDPVVAASAIVTALQTVASRTVCPTDAVVVTIGSIRGGEAYNVVPDTVELLGTIRTLTELTAKLVYRRVREIAEQVAAAHGCEAKVDIEIGYPPTYNDPDATEHAINVARAAIGADNVVDLPAPMMGGEDFAYYAQKVPSSFHFIGVRPRGTESYPMLHTSKYDFTDDAIAVGVRLMCRWALDPVTPCDR